MKNIIFGHINKYLCVVDLIAFRNINKYYWKNTQINIHEKFNSYLNKYFTLPLIKSIRKNNVVFTGSFVLKFLYDAEWCNNDIDIYIGDESGAERWNFIKSLLDNDFEEVDQTGTPANYIISRYFTNSDSTLEINLVSLANIDPIYYIMTVSDMDIGKVAYLCNKDNNKEKLFVKNWNKLITKSDYIVPLSLITSNIYGGRELDTAYNFEESIQKMFERRQKYISRGFDIKIPVNINKIIDIIKKDYNNFTTDIFMNYKKKNIIDLQSFLRKYHTDTSLLINME